MRSNPEVTMARRVVIVEAMREVGKPCRVREIVDVLTGYHEGGRWPRANWAGARQEPYYGYVVQNLREIQVRPKQWGGNPNAYEWVVEGGSPEVFGGNGEWSLTRKAPSKREIAKLRVTWEAREQAERDAAADLLPQLEEAVEVRSRLAAFEERTGYEVLVGVTEGAYVCVLRVDYERGWVEWPKRDDETWTDLLDEHNIR